MQLLIIEILSKRDWDRVQKKLLKYGVKWTNGRTYLIYSKYSDDPIRIYVSQHYQPGLHMSWGTHSSGMTTKEFMKLNLIEYLFDKLL